MKFFVVFIISTFLTSSSCKKPVFKLAPVIPNCSLLLPVQANSHAIFIDLDPKSNSELKACILKNINSEQSMLLVNVFAAKSHIEVNATRHHMTTDTPNVIIMTTFLTPKTVESPLLKLFMKSHWSLLYIIVTSDNKFRCENNTINKEDFLVLDKIMNKLWHKFKVMHVGVVFPSACKQKMVIYKGKRPSKYILYDRTIQLINVTSSIDVYNAIMDSGNQLAQGYPLRGSIFKRYPTSITDCQNLHYYVHFNLNLSLGYCGLDGLVMHDVLSHFRFNLSFSENENCHYYGHANAGNLSGSLGCIVRQELDISFNSRFMTLYSDESIYYLHYVITDPLCALVRKSDVIPLWHGVFNVYTAPLWLLITAVVVIIGVIMWAMTIFNNSITGENTTTFWQNLYDATMTTFFGFTLRKTFLILRITCLSGSVIFMAIYQGHINHVFTTMERFQRIQTLEQLYRSGATLYTSPSMRGLTKQLQNPEDKLQEDFFNRLQTIPGERLEIVLQYPSATTVDRKSDAMMEILEKYSDEDGKPLIDIVDECLYTYYLSYTARSGFPFYEDLQIFLERLKESGLPTKYYKWTQYMLRIPNPVPEYLSESRPFTKISLKDQRVAFGLLFVGHIISIIVFVVEVWKGKRERQREHCRSRLFKRRIS